jgi:hypothetical protein
VPVLKKVIRAMNIPLFESENYEADDVLGSLARKASERRIPAVIVSTDKDLLQLVDECTTVYNPAKEFYLDEAKVQEVFGVAPAQVKAFSRSWTMSRALSGKRPQGPSAGSGRWRTVTRSGQKPRLRERSSRTGSSSRSAGSW